MRVDCIMRYREIFKDKNCYHISFLILSTFIIIGGCDRVKLKSTNIPEESKFEITGIHGCESAIPYNLTIHQKGNEVIIRDLINYNDSREYSVDFKKFESFWKICSSMDINSLSKSYGSFKSTGDFRGSLLIDLLTDKGRVKKKIEIIAGTIRDEQFLDFIDGMLSLVDTDEQILWCLKREELIK